MDTESQPTAGPPVPQLLPDEVIRQMDRVAESSGFAGSDSIRRVFVFLAKTAAERPGKPVKEYELATVALGRETSYDPRTDSTVRVIAGRLRAKLAEYYLREGASDAIVFELPKGSYALSVTRRSLAGSQPPGAGRPSQASREPHVFDRRFFLGTAAGALAVGLPAALFWPRSKHSAAPILRLFWKPFLNAEAPSLIVYSNPSFTGSPETGMRLAEEDNEKLPERLNVYTGTGEVAAVAELSLCLKDLGVTPRIKRAQLFTWDEAPDNSLIFVGGQVQNAAFRLLPKLERFNLKAPADEPYRLQAAVRDTGARPGGADRYYVATSDLDNGTAYGIIALLKAGSPGQKIMILAGTDTYGTEAAARLVCNPQALKGLLSKAMPSSGDALPAFEALIGVRVRGGAPLDSQVIKVYMRS